MPAAARPRLLASRAVKAAAAGFDRLRPPASGITVLAYHRVGGASGLTVDLPVGLFEAQMAELAGRAVSLDDALVQLASAHPPAGPPPVVVTFDDGTADWVDAVLPVLDRHRVPATFFVATGFVEGDPPHGRPLTWAALAELASSPLVTVGSHTHGHLLLDRTPRAVAAEDLDRSIALLGDHLGADVAHFAYPKAVLGSAGVEAEVRSRFRSAALATSRPNPFGATDAHRLARTSIQTTDGMRWFRAKLDGGLRLEAELRSLWGRRRYAGAVT